jgi:hypothetical protein
MIGAEEVLANRLVDSKQFRWLPGMLTLTGLRVVRVEKDDYTTGYSLKNPQGIRELSAIDRPDLTDPATLGCLMTLVRAAWEDDGIGCCASYRRDGTWIVYSSKPTSQKFTARVYANHAATEAEALVNALVCAH